MLEFAVFHEGVAEGQGVWVLAIQGERFLLANAEGQFYWEQVANCKLVRIATPDQPRPVVPVQPGPQQTGLVVAEPNRAFRRNGNN